jgi:hypothetical protein
LESDSNLVDDLSKAAQVDIVNWQLQDHSDRCSNITKRTPDAQNHKKRQRHELQVHT